MSQVDPPHELPELLKLADAASRLNIPINTLRTEIKAGRLKAYRARPGCNAPLLVSTADLMTWLDTHCAARLKVLSPKATATLRRECTEAERKGGAQGASPYSKPKRAELAHPAPPTPQRTAHPQRV